MDRFWKLATVGAGNALTEAQQGGIKNIAGVMERAITRAAADTSERGNEILRRHVEDAANEISKEEANENAAWWSKYDDTCKAATTDQGLDGIVAHLRGVGFDVDVAQTGGFCMVANIHQPCVVESVTFDAVGITNDGGDDVDPAYLVCAFDTEGERDEAILGYELRTKEAVVDILKAHNIAPTLKV